MYAITCCLVFFVSMLIRFWHIEQLPYQSDGDELAYVFAGQSLLEYGQPISWSSFVYPPGHIFENEAVLGNKALHAQNIFKFFTPWFDHPYLLPIIQGWNAEFFGYHFLTIPPSFIIRIPMLFLAGITVLFVYLISRHLFGKNAALLSLVLIGFTPSIAIGQRMVVGENLYIPCMLIALYAVLKKSHPFVPALFITLSGLSKITGLMALPIVLFPLFFEKRYRDAIVITTTSLALFAALFGLYAAVHGWDTFLFVMQTQTYRLLGWSNPAFLLSHPGFHTSAMLDFGYYIILFLGVLPLVYKSKIVKPWMPIIVAFSFLLIWITGAEQDMLGWYKLPLFTFLCIFAGASIDFITTPLVLGCIWIGVCNNIGLVRFPEHPLPSTETLRLVAGILGLSIFALYVVPEKITTSLKKGLLILGFACYGAVSLYTMHYSFAASCKDRVCPIPELNTTSGVKKVIETLNPLKK